jgi:hypothetical protein
VEDATGHRSGEVQNNRGAQMKLHGCIVAQSTRRVWEQKLLRENIDTTPLPDT